MKSFKVGLILVTVALFIFACSQTPTTNSNTTNVNIANNTVTAVNSSPQLSGTLDELASARKTYSEMCIKCHKEGGIGGASVVDGKKIKAPNFTSDRMKKDDDDDWIDSITNGIEDEGMPAYKDKLSEQEIKSLVKMIRTDFQKK